MLKFELKIPFTYGDEGKITEARYIEIKAPNNKIRKFVTHIDQELNKSIFNMSTKQINSTGNSDNTDIELSGNDIIRLMSGCNADMDLCLDNLESILIECALIDGKESFTKYIFEQMDYNETKRLLGEYIKFFLSTSLLT